MSRLRPWLPALVWAAVIFGLSSIPGPQFPLPARNLDKLVHAAIFGVLGALCWRAMNATFLRGAAQWRVVLLAVVLTTLYGLADEMHQMFVPRRSPDPNDVLADALGGFAGALLCVAFVAHRRRRRDRSRGA